MAADDGGRFERLEASSGGQRLELERWGDYFAVVTVPSDATADRLAEIEVCAIRSDGSRLDQVLRVPNPAR